MKKNNSKSTNSNSELDELDKILFSLASKNSETPKQIKETIKKTINEIFK